MIIILPHCKFPHKRQLNDFSEGENFFFPVFFWFYELVSYIINIYYETMLGKLAGIKSMKSELVQVTQT